MQRWIPLVFAALAACGGGNKPVTPPPTPKPVTTAPKSACGCVTEACRANDFNAYFEATFCMWREQSCACTEPACIERSLVPINDFKRSLQGTTLKLPPADVIERAGKHADEAAACVAKVGRAEP